jgi:hypothetical protein
MPGSFPAQEEKNCNLQKLIIYHSFRNAGLWEICTEPNRVISELKRIWKEAVVAKCGVYSGICLEERRRTTKYIRIAVVGAEI